VSFETGDPDLSVRLVEALRVFSIAVSFGGVGSSATVPCRMSHTPLAKAAGTDLPRPATQPPADLVRLAVGIEHPGDLIADLQQAFGAARGGAPAAIVSTPARTAAATHP
jgi:cystathionine beta-lyase/cystathionine gamma-synthase